MTTAELSLPSAHGPRLPAVAQTGLVLFLFLLPFHSLAIAMLYGMVGVPENTVRVIAAWKEAAIVMLVIWVGVRALLSQGPGVRLAALDVTLATLFAIALLFLTTANPFFRANLPPGVLLYGFRDAVFFMSLYYVGRATPEIAASERSLRYAFGIALVVSVIGIVERLYVSPETLVLFGVASYVNDFLSMSAYTMHNEWALPTNYWTTLGGVEWRRSGSVFLHSQGFALPFLVLLPAATVWAFDPARNHRVLTRIGYALLWIGLLLSITRMTTVICVMQVTLYFLMFRKPEWAVGSAIASAAVLAVAVALVPGLLLYIWETLTWQTASSGSHLKDWEQGLLAFLEQPWGHGLGTTDAVAVRFARTPLTADNMYLSYAVQLGVAGLAAFLATVVGILVMSWKLFRSAATHDQRNFAAVLVLTTLGILANGVTSLVFSSLMLAYVYFLFAGSAMTIAQRNESAGS